MRSKFAIAHLASLLDAVAAPVSADEDPGEWKASAYPNDPDLVAKADDELWAEAREMALRHLSHLLGADEARAGVEEADMFRRDLERELRVDRLTPYQFWALAMKQIRIEAAAAELGMRDGRTSTPPIGTRSLGRLNAMVSATKQDGEPVVVFEFGLKGFFNYASKALVGAFEELARIAPAGAGEVDATAIQRIASPDTPLFRRFAQIVLGYLYAGNPAEASPERLQPPAAELSALLEQGMELFVVGHEYGHLLSGHLDKASTQAFSAGEQHFDEMVVNWMQEFEADRAGLELLKVATRMTDPRATLTYSGADLVFTFVALLEESLSVASTGATGVQLNDTHPPPLKRRARMRVYLPATGWIDPANAVSMAEAFAAIVEEMFGNLRPKLNELHSAGVPLHSSWRFHR